MNIKNMGEYEVMILFKPILVEDIKKNTVSKIEKFVEKNKGKFTEVENLGKRLLAYPIKKFDEGNYIEYSLELDASVLDEFKKELNLMDNVLRFLILKK